MSRFSAIIMTLALLVTSPLIAQSFESVDYSYRFMPIDGGGAIQCVEICPYDSNIVMAGVDVGGVMRSEDGGMTWQPANDGLRSEFDFAVSDIAFAPSKPGVVYIVTGKSWSKKSGIGAVFSSTDYGKSWTKLPENLTFSGQWVIRQRDNLIIVDPHDHKHLWVATVFQGVMESTDAGQTWSSAGPENCDVLQALIPLDDACQTLLCAAKDQSEPHGKTDAVFGIWKSPDAGQFWHLVHQASVYALAASANGEIIAAADDTVYRSTDQGDTWHPFNQGLPQNSDQLKHAWFAAGADPHTPGRFIIAAHTSPNPFYQPKIYVRNPGNDTWQPIGASLDQLGKTDNNEGWQFHTDQMAQFYTPYRTPGYFGWHGHMTWLAACPTSVRFDRNTPGVVYMSDWYTVNKSTNTGRTWKAYNSGLVTTVPVNAVWDKLDPEHLYLGLIDVGYHEAWIRQHGGDMFVRSVRDEVPNAHAQVWQFTQGDDVITFVGMNDYPGGNWLYRRVNYGPYQCVYDNQFPGSRRTGLKFAIDHTGTAFVRLTTGQILISRDYANTFTPYEDTIITPQQQQAAKVSCPEFKNNQWYVTVDGSGYQTDTIAQWLPTDTAHYRYHPDDPDIVWYIKTGVPKKSRDVLMLSTDAGQSFTESLTFPWSKRTNVVLTSSPSITYAWVVHWSGSIIYRTTDAGQTWQQLPDEPGYQIQNIIPDPRNPQRFLLATHGLGFWLAEPKTP